MPEMTVLSTLLCVLRDRLAAAARPGTAGERGGIISEYAVVLTIAVAAIAIIGVLIAAIRSRFQAFSGS
ncbi:MAG TPA: hypothetical protein VKG45_06125 [Actinomycetes bacterium]|nr:hypothetical protein [Actinomycetes bacterium]